MTEDKNKSFSCKIKTGENGEIEFSGDNKECMEIARKKLWGLSKMGEDELSKFQNACKLLDGKFDKETNQCFLKEGSIIYGKKGVVVNK